MLSNCVLNAARGIGCAIVVLAAAHVAHADGDLIWAQQFGTNGAERWSKVAVGRDGNIYVGGDTDGRLAGTTSYGGLDGLLVKYSPSGALLWTRRLGTTGTDKIYGITTDSQINIIVCGYTTGPLAGYTPQGNLDAFLTKYAADGTLRWTRQLLLSTPQWDIATDVAVDRADNIFVGGYTEGSYAGPNQGNRDVFLAKFTTTGSLLWRKQFGGAGLDAAYGVSVDQFGNAYITGFTYNNLDGVNAGVSDAFVAKYDTNGTQLWVRQLGSRRADGAYGVSVDTHGNVVIAGRADGPLGGPAIGDEDAFVAKYTTNGTLLWVKHIGTPQFDRAYGVATDPDDNVVVVGHTEGTLESVPGEGNSDVFVAKFNSAGTPLWVRQFGSSGQELIYGVASDAAGNFLITGLTTGSFAAANAGRQDSILLKVGP